MSSEKVCFRLQVRPDRVAEYRARHVEVWDDMLTALSETGWTNYSLFLDDDGLLIGYLETEDLEATLDGMAKREVNARWQNEMAPFFEDLNGATPDRGFHRLSEVFNLETQISRL
jgi:L-rhamnose mutarotase